MSDLHTNGLMQQMHANAHSGEYLEVLGKRAAAGWSAGEHKTLTDAVTATVKQAQLSPEQVRRVVEFTNTAAYLTEFKKEGASHHVVDFPGGPADASAILQDLNDGGGGSVFDTGRGDYNSPPGETKVASVAAEEELEELFGKTAAPALPYENPHGEVLTLRDKLAGVADQLQSQMSELEVMYAELGDRMYHEVKQAALGGTSLGDIMQAWESVMPSADHVKVAFTLITPRLLREGVFHSVEAMTDSVDKTASARIVNPEHPLVVEFAEFADALSKLAELREARTEVRVHLDRLNAYVKQAAGGGIVGKAWRAAGRAGEAASPFVRTVAGDTAATIAKHAPRVALVGGAALAAHEVNQHIDNSPGMAAGAARAVKRTVKQQIPGSEEYYRHLQEIQYGR